MTLTSEQSKAMNAQPKITVEDRDRLISALAEGRKPEELAAEYGKAVGTIYNFKTRWKAEIDDLRRSRTVQFSDVAGTRKQARIDDLWDLRTAYKMLFKAHVESCFIPNPDTGLQEFVESLVDWKKLKAYSSEVRASLKALMIETGQQLRLDDEWAEKALGLDGHNGVDYPALVADTPRREAEAKWLLLEERRDLIDHDWKLEHQADVLQAKGYIQLFRFKLSGRPVVRA